MQIFDRSASLACYRKFAMLEIRMLNPPTYDCSPWRSGCLSRTMSGPAGHILSSVHVNRAGPAGSTDMGSETVDCLPYHKFRDAVFQKKKYASYHLCGSSKTLITWNMIRLIHLITNYRMLTVWERADRVLTRFILLYVLCHTHYFHLGAEDRRPEMSGSRLPAARVVDVL